MRDVSHTKSERWAQVKVFPTLRCFFFVENHVIAPNNRPLIIRVFPQVLSYTDLLCFISNSRYDRWTYLDNVEC